MIEQRYKLNLIPDASYPVIVHASQFDVGRKMIFTLYDGAVEYTPSADTTAIVEGTKSDKTIFVADGDIVGSNVSFVITKQMCASEGNAVCELRLQDNKGNNLGTANFTIAVEQSAIDPDTEFSENDFALFQNAIDKTVENVAEAKDACELSKAMKEDFDKIKNFDLFSNLSIAGGSWVSDETYTDKGYGFRGDILINNVDATMIPEVVLAPSAKTNLIAPFAVTGAGKVSLYASENIEDDTSVLRISIRNNNDVDKREIVSLDEDNVVHVANDLSTTESGYVLDARQGKILNDSIQTNTSKINKLNKDVSDCNEVVRDLSNFIIINPTVTGDTVSLNDSAEYPIQELHLFGKSTQNGTPTPDNPIDIVNVVNPTVKVTDGADAEQTASIAATLCGLPVTSGGNYTDGNGQQYICDELVRYADGTGKLIQNFDVLNITIPAGSIPSGKTCRDYFLRNTKNYIGKVEGKKVSLCSICKYEYGASDEPHFYIEPTQMRFYVNSAERIDNIIVLAQLVTPTVTALSAEQVQALEALHTYYPSTTITADGAGLAVKYVADPTLYIDNKYAELASAIIASASEAE